MLIGKLAARPAQSVGCTAAFTAWLDTHQHRTSNATVSKASLVGQAFAQHFHALPAALLIVEAATVYLKALNKTFGGFGG